MMWESVNLVVFALGVVAGLVLGAGIIAVLLTLVEADE
jgi:hypothetical protein